jgi:2-polyprenyl-3-methyl-5-hydroxy-6-metoxy-1,4-benzoquinol methylase
MVNAAQHFEYPEQYYNSQSAEQVLPVLFSKKKPASLLDVGCGNGSWLKVAEKLGITDLKGIDAQEQLPGEWPLPADKFELVNLQEPFDLNRKFDMVLCLEVAEHLPEKDASNLIESLTKHSDLIVFSAAIPRQGGYMHINEQAPAYWQKLFNQSGFNTYDDIRPVIWNNEKIFWWYRQNIFIAERAGVSGGRPSENILYLVHPDNYIEKDNNRQMLADNKADLIINNNYWKQVDQSIEYHLRRVARLIISGKAKK